MRMKKGIAVLTLAAMLLALACPALAEEAAKEPWEIPVTEEELLGVWKADGNEDLEMLIVPGSYAPVPERSKTPQLYGEGAWQEGDGMQVTYLMLLNKRGTEEGGGLLNALLGSTLAGAVKAIGALGNNDSNLEDVDAWDYTHASIGVEWITEEGDDYYNVTSDASGSFYAFHDEDMSVTLYWMDNYDPHALAQMLRRVTVAVPSAEALTQGVLTPVIDMSADARVQTALALMRWASENKCARMDSAALADGLRAALAALEPEKAQAFRDNYAKISDMALDAMGLNPETMFSAERGQPFKDAGLADALELLTSGTENMRAVELLDAAIEGAKG